MKRIHDIEAGTYRLKWSRKHLDLIIRQVVHDLDPVAERSGVTVRFSVPEKETVTSLDRELIPGVFTNLILNSIEHVAKLTNPGEKTVTVELARERDWYIVRINNKGTPIPSERLATFFEKFNVGPEKKEGTGLGTTYAFLVTKAHGGEISVNSNEKEGTTVTVALPVSPPG
jgi:signal transduction histidine kinase